MCPDSRGIEWLFEKRGSESFDLISKSRKRLWWVSKSHFRVILRLGVSKLETRVSQSRIYHSIPLIVVCELESGKKKEGWEEDWREDCSFALAPCPNPSLFFLHAHVSLPRVPTIWTPWKNREEIFSSRFFHSYPKQRACSQATWKTQRRCF